VLFLTAFPLTATGKVQRFRLREYALAQQEAAATATEAVAGGPA